MSRDLLNAETIFAQAIELAAPEDRAAFLDRVCGEDAQLRVEVNKLVGDHFRAGGFLERPAIEQVATIEEPLTERPGTLIGPYKLMEQIGEGGMGLVFVAEQQQPVRRKVALKVLKPGMDTRQVIARFEAERQALALMDHPNIARVLEAGATPSGRPYFVMELVKGVPITEYCDDHRLTPRERLELFVSVCQAVQHAHQKGIIHRDVKPSNVMITSHDGTPVVKVIDFGVAKAVGQQLTEKTLYTAFTQMIGTPQYMSPEQAGMSSLDVDTRSDIYSLGVLLYELLTGTTPFDGERLRTAAYDEVRRIIREEEPPRPSSRVGTPGPATTTTGGGARAARHASDTALLSTQYDLAKIAAQRQSDPARLRQLLRGELDWIVMKALEKDRNRRYATANSLAADVQRYLHDEPVQACPPSTWYKLRKFARRHRGAFAIACTAALAVLLSLVGLAISNVLIRQEQARTKNQKDRADQARQLAEDRAAEIRQGLERLKAANGWLERGGWYTNLQQWDDANAAFTKAVELRPDHATAWVARGDLFAQLGLWHLASADFSRGFELREPDTTTRWFRHALLRLSLGDADGYRRVRRRMRERFGGTSHLHFASEVVRTCVLGSDPDDVEPLVELAQQLADLRPGSWYELYVLGIAHYRAGHYEQATLRLRESLTADPDWSGRAISYPVLAMAQHRRGEIAEARQSLQCAADAIDRWTREMYQGPAERVWAVNQGAGAVWPIVWWDWLECQLYFREAKLLIDGSPPPDDPRLHVLRARAFAGLRRHFTADDEYTAILQRWPDDTQFRMEAHRCAGYSAVARGQWRTATAEFAKAVELRPEDSYLWRFRAVACFAAGDLDAYRQTCTAMLERFEKNQEPQTAGNVLLVCALSDDALTDMARLLPLADRVWHSDASARGAALYRAGRYDEAIQCFETAARLSRPRAWDWGFLAMAHHRLGHAHAAEARRCVTEAARWIDEANRREDDDLSGTRPAWGGWHEAVVYPLLLREAEALLAE